MIILCFGDSNTWGYDPRGYFGGQYDHPWPELLKKKINGSVLNWGENGREIPVRPVDFPADLDLLIIMLGTNDLLQFCSPEAACRKMEVFLESLAFDREKLLLIAPPFMKFGEWVQNQEMIDKSIALAKHYKSLAECLGIRFADAGLWDISLAYDGVHLTEEGHRAFAERLFIYLNKGE